MSETKYDPATAEPVRLKVTIMEKGRGFQIKNESEQPLDCDVAEVVGAGPLVRVTPGQTLILQHRFVIQESIEPTHAVTADVREELDRVMRGGVQIEGVIWTAKEGGQRIAYNYALDRLDVAVDGGPVVVLAPKTLTAFPPAAEEPKKPL